MRSASAGADVSRGAERARGRSVARRGETGGGLDTAGAATTTGKASQWGCMRVETQSSQGGRTEERARGLAEVEDQAAGLGRREPGHEPLVSPCAGRSGPDVGVDLHRLLLLLLGLLEGERETAVGRELVVLRGAGREVGRGRREAGRQGRRRRRRRGRERHVVVGGGGADGRGVDLLGLAKIGGTEKGSGVSD